MTKSQKTSLEYVRNTNGGATRANFVDDFEPIGEILWNDIAVPGWVTISDDGKIRLTSSGNAELGGHP